LAEFKKGDIVRLKSGGPAMTVEIVSDYSPMGPEVGVLCIWFVGPHQEQHVFDAAVLEKSQSGARARGRRIRRT
jgi:uncharacterized protein YodC (DUF2158 family)